MSNAKPFVKWAGGKRKIVYLLRLRFPNGFPNKTATYWEPFVGGGAVFFAIADQIEHAVLSDKNVELMTTYRVVKSYLPELVDQLEFHARKHSELGRDHYYSVRDQSPRSDVCIASRFLYLNKTCFNGLYRVNKNGTFNVPMGDYTNPNICDKKTLCAVSEVLKRAEIRSGDYTNECVVYPNEGDFVYCDPPYDKTFTQYVSDGFGRSDQELLFAQATKWARKANVMVSNAQTDMIKCIWGGVETFFNRRTPGHWIERIESWQHQ